MRTVEPVLRIERVGGIVVLVVRDIVVLQPPAEHGPLPERFPTHLERQKTSCRGGRRKQVNFRKAADAREYLPCLRAAGHPEDPAERHETGKRTERRYLKRALNSLLKQEPDSKRNDARKNTENGSTDAGHKYRKKRGSGEADEQCARDARQRAVIQERHKRERDDEISREIGGIPRP